MSAQPKPNCKVIRLGAVGALLECVDGRDEQAAAMLATLNDAELHAVEDAAVALSLHASRARKAIEERAEASATHFLVVHEEPEDGMEIDHPDTCPFATLYGGRVEVRTCLPGDVEMQFGLEDYFHRTGTQGEGEAVAVGRHPIEYWTNGATDDRFECGLRLVPAEKETR